jgi:predicted nucleotidyltransferase
MRLSSFEIASIVELVKKHFANNAEVYLFGSRVNDELKGGDIDL